MDCIMNASILADIEALLKNMTIEELVALVGYEPDVEVERRKVYRNVIVSCAYAIIVLVSFFGNCLVCRVCLQNMTKTNTLILSLSSSDLLMTIFNIPFNVVRLLRDEWPFGQFLCFLVPFVQVMVVYVSSFTMAAIAIFRLRSVSSMTTASISRHFLWAVIVIIWFLSALFAIPTSMFNKTVELYTYKSFVRCRVEYPESEYNIPVILSIEVFLTQYFIPLSLTCIVYVKIGKYIARQGKIISLRGSCEAQRRQKQKRRRLVMLALVVVVFAICWLPLHIFHILVDLDYIGYDYKLFITCHWFAMSSVCYNPFIYCWLNETFRRGAKNFMFWLFHCKKPITEPLESLQTNQQNLDLSIRPLATTILTNVNNTKNTIELQQI